MRSKLILGFLLLSALVVSSRAESLPVSPEIQTKLDAFWAAKTTNSIRSVPVSLEEQAEFYEKAIAKAAEKLDAEALLSLGKKFDYGWDCEKNKIVANVYFKAAAKKGHAGAQMFYGEALMYGLGIRKDEDEALKWLQKAAEQGDPFAQEYLKPLTKRIALRDKINGLLIKAEQGDVDSQFALAEIYLNSEAFAAHQTGFKFSNTAAGFLCGAQEQNSVLLYEVEAFKWYKKAAEQNHVDAQSVLGKCYLQGIGTSTNYDEAVLWLTKAAENGNVEAQFNLSDYYDSGVAEAKNHKLAFKWILQAANQGHPEAQKIIGRDYQNGTRVVKDPVEAYKWFLLAQANGASYAHLYVDSIEKELSPNQISEGQSRARNFKPQLSFNSKASSPGDQTTKKELGGTGTGFFITTDGYLISNNHVVKDGSEIQVIVGAGTYSAKVIAVDAANDFALLKAQGKFTPLAISPSRTVKLGDTVATVGFPAPDLQGVAPKFAKGEIAALSGAADDPRYFQISVPVQPGNSGGALVDEHGNVVGVVAAKLSAKAALDANGTLPENVNYALKSSFLLSFLESVPNVAAKLLSPSTQTAKSGEVIKSAQGAAALILVY